MVETIRYTKLYKEDIAFGTGVAEVELHNGEVLQLTEVNLSHLHDGDNAVLYASSDSTVDVANFVYDPDNTRLQVPSIVGGDGASETLTLAGTTHATSGNIIMNASGGNVGIGVTPSSLLHLSSSATSELLINTSSATADPQLVFSISSTDKFAIGVDNSDSDKFKISNGAAVGAADDIVLTSANLVGIGTASPTGKFHVMSATTSTTPETDADELVVENTASGGITIATNSGNTGSIRFSRSTSTTAGAIQYNHGADDLIFSAAEAEKMRLTGTPQLLLGTATEDGFGGIGTLVIDQDTADGQAVVLKSSTDVAHGVTDVATTSTYGYMSKYSATLGGLFVSGVTEGTVGAALTGIVTTATTTSADTSDAAVLIRGLLKSGTATTAMGATDNICAISAGTSANVVLIKGDGDVYNSGGSTAMTTYDDYDDVKLLQAVKGAMSLDYKQQLGEWVDEHTGILERGGVISRGEQGGWFISQRGFRGLLIDAIRQLDSRLRAIEAGPA